LCKYCSVLDRKVFISCTAFSTDLAVRGLNVLEMLVYTCIHKFPYFWVLQYWYLHFRTLALPVLHFRLDCLRKILQGQADFGVFEAEDIIVASSYKNADVLITNEIRRFNSKCIFKFLVINGKKKRSKSRITWIIITHVYTWRTGFSVTSNLFFVLSLLNFCDVILYTVPRRQHTVFDKIFLSVTLL